MLRTLEMTHKLLSCTCDVCHALQISMLKLAWHGVWQKKTNRSLITEDFANHLTQIVKTLGHFLAQSVLNGKVLFLL